MATVDNSIRSSSKNQPIGLETGLGSGVILSDVKVQGGNGKGGSGGMSSLKIGDDSSVANSHNFTVGGNLQTYTAPITFGLGDSAARSAFETAQVQTTATSGNFLDTLAANLGVKKEHLILAGAALIALFAFRRF